MATRNLNDIEIVLQLERRPYMGYSMNVLNSVQRFRRKFLMRDTTMNTIDPKISPWAKAVVISELNCARQEKCGVNPVIGHPRFILG